MTDKRGRISRTMYMITLIVVIVAVNNLLYVTLAHNGFFGKEHRTIIERVKTKLLELLCCRPKSEKKVDMTEVSQKEVELVN